MKFNFGKADINYEEKVQKLGEYLIDNAKSIADGAESINDNLEFRVVIDSNGTHILKKEEMKMKFYFKKVDINYEEEVQKLGQYLIENAKMIADGAGNLDDVLEFRVVIDGNGTHILFKKQLKF